MYRPTVGEHSDSRDTSQRRVERGLHAVVLEARRARSAPLHWRITDSHHCHWIRDNGMALRQEEPLVKNLVFVRGDAMCQKELPASANSVEGG